MSRTVEIREVPVEWPDLRERPLPAGWDADDDEAREAAWESREQTDQARTRAVMGLPSGTPITCQAVFGPPGSGAAVRLASPRRTFLVAIPDRMIDRADYPLFEYVLYRIAQWRLAQTEGE